MGQPVPADFHARTSARGRRYRLRAAGVAGAARRSRPGWWAGCSVRCDGDAMRQAAAVLVGEHDFTSFRSAECQAASPVKTLRAIDIERRGAYWRFEFDASAFLHHMVRNIMGCLLAVGRAGAGRSGWPRCWRRATATPRRRPSPPTACTSSGRTTMRTFGCPSARLRSTGCHEASVVVQHRTRIKICGLTREEDVDAAVEAGADAVGFVLYARSPRHVSAERAPASWRARLPPFVTPVLLFVNADADEVAAACEPVPRAAAAVPRRRDAGSSARPPARALPARRPHGARGFDLLDFAAALPERPGPAARRPCRGLRRRRKGIRLVTHSTKRARSARFVWWVESCKRDRWGAARPAMGR